MRRWHAKTLANRHNLINLINLIDLHAGAGRRAHGPHGRVVTHEAGCELLGEGLDDKGLHIDDRAPIRRAMTAKWANGRE
jgi:hypothetical protein